MYELLDKIQSPADVKALPQKSLSVLCEEIRAFLTDTVSKTGGHLASNLGVVELTVALHRVFDVPKDSIIFDVGHQCYTHKLLTGRKAGFARLRKKDGLSGFPKPNESDADPFVEGHSSTSVSSAIGLARANLLCGKSDKVIAVIGDGSFTGGMVYEAINNIDSSLKNLVVVLNDNEMSISKSVGSVARYLLHLRTDSGYSKLKRTVQKVLQKTPLVGKPVMQAVLKSKSALRRAIYDSTFFEELGFNYIGPVDGHDMDELIRILGNIRDLNGPILLHVKTVKGKGFALAEVNPGAYHGVGKFDLEEGNPDISLSDSYSNVFGRKLAALAESDDKICAVTAAMKYGTGLQYFYRQHRSRFFDVGIAEQHAATFCAGLAKGGMKPVFAVYSTFLQRAFDQLSQDISLSRMNVMLAIDRAGLVGDDGETHQGLFDVMMLGALGSFSVASPANYAELEYWLQKLFEVCGPTAIRYPRGSEDPRLKSYGVSKKTFDLIGTKEKGDILIVTYGRIFADVLDVQTALKEQGTKADILKLNLILPIDKQALALAAEYDRVYFIEEAASCGGLGEQFGKKLLALNSKIQYKIQAIDDPVVRQGTVDEQMKECGLDAESLVRFINGD